MQAGTEIVQSYFPLNLHYSERQQRTRTRAVNEAAHVLVGVELAHQSPIHSGEVPS